MPDAFATVFGGTTPSVPVWRPLPGAPGWFYSQFNDKENYRYIDPKTGQVFEDENQARLAARVIDARSVSVLGINLGRPGTAQLSFVDADVTVVFVPDNGNYPEELQPKPAWHFFADVEAAYAAHGFTGIGNALQANLKAQAAAAIPYRYDPVLGQFHLPL